MIVDLERFLREERAYWRELETMLEKRAERADLVLDLAQARRFYYLYRRTASDLARIESLAAEASTRAYLENLVGAAYAEIQGTRPYPTRLRPLIWFFQTFPQTVRAHALNLWVSIAVTLVGSVFGAAALALDYDAKAVLMPFSHLQGRPSERVADEENVTEDRLQGHKSTFAAMLMTNNIRVSIGALALGVTFGFGTFLLLFYNGVILGAVVADYVLDGQSVFLTGWLLPHGSVEIPAILLAGQAGLILGNALIGWGNPLSLQERLRAVGADLVTLIFGVAIMLVWAGIIEAFFSQYHAPVIPYALKIAFGAVQLILLCAFLLLSGRSRSKEADARTPAMEARHV